MTTIKLTVAWQIQNLKLLNLWARLNIWNYLQKTIITNNIIMHISGGGLWTLNHNKHQLQKALAGWLVLNLWLFYWYQRKKNKALYVVELKEEKYTSPRIRSLILRKPSIGTRKRYVKGVPFANSASISASDAVAHFPMYTGGSCICFALSFISSSSFTKNGCHFRQRY